MNWWITCDDSLKALRAFDDNSIDSIVTDPPYGLSFMGKRWDYDVPSEAIWRECLRVLKPGGYLLAFAGTRTQHRMAVRIEDAGFEIRDMIAWVYGSGFPKSLNVSKAIDKAAGAEREVVGQRDTAVGNGGTGNNFLTENSRHRVVPITAPATDAACQWDGWGTALKPSLEPVTVARKPLDGTVAANVLKHGTGGLNIDGCRVEAGEGDNFADAWDKPVRTNVGEKGGAFITTGVQHMVDISGNKPVGGRWPANLIHDGSEEVVRMFPRVGASKSGGKAGWQDQYVGGSYKPIDRTGYDEPAGSAARFFYTAKADEAEREVGCDKLPKASAADLVEREAGSAGMNNPRAGAGRTSTGRANTHPTVKPVDLMRYLVRLVTPKGGVVLDPFMGSGTTGIAALLEGCQFAGIDLDPHHVEIARARIKAAETGEIHVTREGETKLREKQDERQLSLLGEP